MPDRPGDVMLWLNDRLGRSVNLSVVVERGDLDVTVVEGEGVLKHWTQGGDARSLAVPRDDLAGAYRVGATDFDVTRLVNAKARLLDDPEIQSAHNTKNAGARRSDIEALKRAARPLRGHRQPVEMYIAVLAGRAKSAPIRNDPDITVLGSDDFWESITGISDFRPRLLRASTVLSWLVRRRSADEVERIKREARELYGDSEGRLNLEALANPPRGRGATPPQSLA